MKRVHLFEFEDQSWFPDWIRVCMTRYISAFHKLLGSKVTLAELVARALAHAERPAILDLCSGNGGPMVEVAEVLRQKYGFTSLSLSLSDLYPNQKAAEAINGQNDPSLRYIPGPVDAANVDKGLIGFKGLRTMVCSMHHMRPKVAKQILKDAKEAHQPICIYEISDNAPPIFLWWFAIPFAFLMTFFVTPMVRPMTWQQLVFTYLVPIIPLFIAWDGAVSNARTYTLSDLDELTDGLGSPTYSWEKGVVKGKGGGKVYLLGLPTTDGNTAQR